MSENKNEAKDNKAKDAEPKVFVRKPVMFLGTDLTRIPCFRDSIKMGISCGVFGGIICLLATSNSRKSMHVGFISGWLSILCCWMVCQYKRESRLLIKEEAKRHNRELFTKIMEEDIKKS